LVTTARAEDATPGARRSKGEGRTVTVRKPKTKPPTESTALMLPLADHSLSVLAALTQARAPAPGIIGGTWLHGT
jgi:hypothetical protein